MRAGTATLRVTDGAGAEAFASSLPEAERILRAYVTGPVGEGLIEADGLVIVKGWWLHGRAVFARNNKAADM